MSAQNGTTLEGMVGGLPGVRQFGLNTNMPVDFSGAPSVALPGGTTIAGASNITSTSATALTVAASGTNYGLQVDESATNAITGLKITAAASGSGVALSALGGANESLSISTKGTGTLILKPGTDSTGAAGFYKADGTTRLFVLDSTNARALHAVGLQFQPATGDSANAISFVNNAVNATMLSVDTSNNRVSVGGVTPTTTLDVRGAILMGHTTAAINSTNTATAAQVATGYITSTSGAATTITLPTGSALGTQLGAVQGTIHDLYIDNTAGSNTVTIAVAVNGILSAAAAANAASQGLLTVPSGVTGQACFRLMFSSATAYTFTRIA